MCIVLEKKKRSNSQTKEDRKFNGMTLPVLWDSKKKKKEVFREKKKDFFSC